MFEIIKNAGLSLISYLSSNMAPPNTPNDSYDEIKSINHMQSKKFYIVLTSVLILAFFYFITVGIMFFIPQTAEFISGFVTIFSKTIEILAIIIASYVGAQAAVDLKYGSSSGSSIQGSSQTITENINEVTFIQTNVKDDDYELV